MGFDIEIWNELTFDSQFLQLSDYYVQSAASGAGNTWAQVVQATASVVSANPSLFAGAVITDGFANTIPWPSSVNEPAQVNSLSKHLYPGLYNFPADQELGGSSLNALLQTEFPPAFNPTYTALFAEYFASGIQFESVIHDMGPFTSSIYGTNHGADARVINGQVAPVSIAITETGIPPGQFGVTNTTQALLLKAKVALRSWAFFLNKGANQVDIYSTVGSSDTDFGLILNSFATYTGTTYPANDSSYVSPALQGLGNIVTQMNQGLDTTITASTARSLTVNQIYDTHHNYQFTGDGTAAHPNLYDREVFTFLPYQVNAHKFVIPYYVATRNQFNAFTPENFTIDISGMNAIGATITAYDPLNNVSVPITLNQASSTEVIITLTAADYPYLLTVQEQQ
jgi:hypothetical protein